MGTPATPWDPSYEEEQGWICHRYELVSGNVIRFAARDVRKERTGVHANVSISMNRVTLAWSNFNIEKDEDRVRLSNSAFTHIDEKANALDLVEFPKNLMKHGLDLFCLGLWEFNVGQDIGEMMMGDETIGPPKLLVGSYIIDGGGTIMYAAPGRGKSYTAMAMAVSLAWGVEKIWKISDARNVLYINIERSTDSMKWRLSRVNRALGLPTDNPLPFLNARGKSFSDVYEAASRTAEMHSCSVVILDSISRAGVGDLNENQPVNRAIDMLNKLAPTWFAIAHTPRSDESHVYGSVHFEAGEDLGVGLVAQSSADGRRTGIGLRVDKANDIMKPPLSIHAMDWDERGLVNIRKSNTQEFPELAVGEQQDVVEMAREYLLMVGRASATEVAKELGKDRSTMSRILNAALGIAKMKDGKEVKFYIPSSPQ